MDLSQYDALKQAYYDANPYTGDTSQYYGADALAGGWGNEADMAATNRPQDEWVDNTYQDWLGGLTPEQRDEYKTLVHNRYASEQGKMRLAMAAATAAMGGLGAMGANAGATGTAVGAGEGVGSFIPGVDSALSGYGFTSEIPAWAQGAAGAGWTGGVTSGALSGGIMDYIKTLGTGAIKNLGSNFLSQLISAGTNAYMGNKQAGQYQSVIDEINRLYSPNSPYALQMKQALARKDAAAGRNSQYGTREVELAAALTKDKANALTSAGYGNLLAQRGINQNVPWNGFLAALGSGPGQDLITRAGGGIASWLSGLYGNSGEKVIPTQPNSGNNWWNMVFADGGP